MNDEYKKLIGFEVQSRVKARCPAGHTFQLDIVQIITPQDHDDFSQYDDIFGYYLKDSYKILSEHPCAECERESRTKWK